MGGISAKDCGCCGQEIGAQAELTNLRIELVRLREAIREETAPYVNDSGPIGGLASRLRALTEGEK